MSPENPVAADEINPFTTIISPHENLAEPDPQPIGGPGDPRVIAPNALDTLLYATETPMRQTPPTNGEVATDTTPPTEEALEPVDDGLEQNTPEEVVPPDPPEELRVGDPLPPVPADFLTPDRPPTPVSAKQPKVAGGSPAVPMQAPEE